MNTASSRDSRVLKGHRWRVALLYTLALGLGIGSAWLALRLHTQAGGVAVGAWRTTALAGSTGAGMATRAAVALGGLLALSREETVYYTARVDSGGQVLRSRCSYRVSGQPPAARWWSVTAYAEDLFLFAQTQGRYSLNGDSAPLDAGGRFAFVTGPDTPKESVGDLPWLPTPGDRGLVLTLRLYNPAPLLVGSPGALVPPVIEMLGVCA
ncbi:MAG: hypothetical protein RLZZ401_248 [Pseudomonadota bacterium]|jgi:hypothetical protein